MALRRLGQILIDLGIIDEQQLEQMLEEQSARGGELLGRVGISLSMITEEQLAEALAEQWSTTVAGILTAPVPWGALARNPDYAIGSVEYPLGGGRAYPTSKPHPWRTKRQR
jgi:hypothetical protein